MANFSWANHPWAPLALGLLLGAAHGLDTPQASAQPGPLATWQQQCKADVCYLFIDAPTVPMADQSRDFVSLGVEVFQSNHQAKSVSIVLPPGVTKGQTVVIGFVDVADRDLKQAEGGALYELPINLCFDGGCAARVQPLLDNGNGSTFDLFQALKKHPYLWVSYQRNGRKEPSRAFVPIHDFQQALNKVP